MTKLPFPDAVLAHHTAVLGKTGLPAYKRDPRKVLCVRDCAHCHATFPVAKKFPDARFCSRRCGLAATVPADHNARVSRETVGRRAAKMRGRGQGKSYPKLNGRHAHRVVAEQKLGRSLLPGEVVHHRDENKRNFSADNLDVLPTQADHARLHATWKDPSKRGRKPGTVIEFNGRRQNISAWAREFGMRLSTLSYRLRRGWELDRALGLPAQFGRKP